MQPPILTIMSQELFGTQDLESLLILLIEPHSFQYIVNLAPETSLRSKDEEGVLLSRSGQGIK